MKSDAILSLIVDMYEQLLVRDVKIKEQESLLMEKEDAGTAGRTGKGSGRKDKRGASEAGLSPN